MGKKIPKEIYEKAMNMMIEENKSGNQVAKELGLNAQNMLQNIKKHFDWSPLKDGKKSVDSDYFETIDTEEKAYWLGFLTADGYISTKSNSIELALKESDYDHIKKFQQAIKSKHKIGKRHIKNSIAYRINIKDKKMAKDIADKSFINKKSFDAFIYKELESHLIRHYIRGLIEGDGYISKDGKTIELTSASKCLVQDFLVIIKKEFNYDCKIKKRSDSKAVSVRILNSAISYKVLDWLYKDASIYLDRKYSIYNCRLNSTLQKN